MLTTTFTDDRDIYPAGARVLKDTSACPKTRSSEDEVLWRDYSDRVIAICETVRTHDRHRKATGNAGKALLSTPTQFRGLDKIVKVNYDSQTALVEANVTMETLVEAVRPLHLTPTVVAESRSITVADAFATTTNASSSSRFGTFDCTVMTAGVVLGNGQFESSSVNDPDGGELLQRSAGAFHSLGIATMLEIALVKAGPYVEVTYTPVSSVSEMIREIVVAASQSAELESSIDFVEGILLDASSGMIVTGRRVLFSHNAVSQALATGDDFTEHVRSVRRRHRRNGSREPVVELFPVEHYLFRHNERRSIQQVRKERFPWSAARPAANTVTTGAAKFLDFAVSKSAAQEVVALLIAEYDSWPIWICPVTPPNCFGRSKTFSLEPAANKLFLNISIWASVCARDGSIDVHLRQKDSFRYLHSRAPCPPETVWFDHDDRRYACLRSRWQADTLAGVDERLRMPNPLRCTEIPQRHTWTPESFAHQQSTLDEGCVSP